MTPPLPRPLTGNAQGVAWPPVFAENGHLAALVMTLEQTQWMDAKTLAAKQGAQLASLVAHHAARSPAFAARLEAVGLDASSLSHPDDLAKLPRLSRAEAQALGDLPPAEVPRSHLPLNECQSSGSSGVPVKVRKTGLNQLFWMAMTLRYHHWAERGPFGRLATIRPDVLRQEEAPHWGAPVALFHQTGPICRIPSETPLERQAMLLATFRPDSVIVYPSNLLALRESGEAGRAALKTVSVFRTMGETLPAHLREAVESETGARVFDCYSAEEAGYIAIQCPDGPGYHVMSESLIVEILDEAGKPCRKGRPGRVVVTDLHNLATPLIRYDTGDYAVPGKPCPCGRGLPVIERVAGRWRGMIVKPDGSRHWPLTGFRDYRKIAPVRQYQMLQHAIDRIELRLVVDDLTKAQHDALTAHLQKKIGHGIAFEIATFADRLPPGPRGKTDEFISLIGETG